MQQNQQEGGCCSNSGRLALWMALLVALGTGFSLGFACAMPFAAFAAIGALTLSSRAALLLICGAWLANQTVGYLLLDYPHTANSYGWGLVIGASAVAATFAAISIAPRLSHLSLPLRAAGVFVTAFLVYQGILWAAMFTPLGGIDHINASEITRLFILNAVALVALLGLHWLNSVTRFLPLSEASSELHVVR